MPDETAVERSRRVRSPAYPSMGLKDALEKARVVYDKDKAFSAKVDVVLRHWGYTNPTSGRAQGALSALKQFGLLDETGTPGNREIKLSAIALSIIQDKVPDSPERARAIKTAALKPKIYAELWSKWGPDLPSVENIETYLVRDRQYNEDAVKGLIDDYKATIQFAKLEIGGTLTQEDGAKKDSLDDGGQIKGGSGREPLHKRRPSMSGTKQDIFTLDEGQAVLEWPASITRDSFQDMKDWIGLALRKIERSLGQPSPPADSPEDVN